MNIEFNLTGEERKKLVKAISEITEATAEYQYMPTCAYIIGGHTVTKEGTLIIGDDANEKEIHHLLVELAGRGYQIPDSNNKFTVQMPLDLLNERTLNRVRRIIENKGELFKSAFKTDSLEFQVTEKTVDFPCLLYTSPSPRDCS